MSTDTTDTTNTSTDRSVLLGAVLLAAAAVAALVGLFSTTDAGNTEPVATVTATVDQSTVQPDVEAVDTLVSPVDEVPSETTVETELETPDQVSAPSTSSQTTPG